MRSYYLVGEIISIFYNVTKAFSITTTNRISEEKNSFENSSENVDHMQRGYNSISTFIKGGMNELNTIAVILKNQEKIDRLKEYAVEF